MRRTAVTAVCLLAAVLLSACQSSQDLNEKRKVIAEKQRQLANLPLNIGPIDRRIKLLGVTTLNNPDRSAVVLSLRNTSGQNLKDIPVRILVSSRKGARPFYDNTAPGFGADLNHIPLLRAGEQFDWINDEVSGGKAAYVKASVGTGKAVGNVPPDAKLMGFRWWNDAVSGWAYRGRAKASSSITQLRMFVYGVMRSGGRIVGAGRSAIDRLAPGGKPPLVAIYPVGAGARSGAVTLTAPPVTFTN